MKRKELVKLLPKNRNDVEAAKSIVQLGSPLIDPVFKDMLLFLRVSNSPVADIFSTYFANLLPQPIELIGDHIGTHSELLRNNILVNIVKNWPIESIRLLNHKLTTYATHPDTSNNDVECLELVIAQQTPSSKN